MSETLYTDALTKKLEELQVQILSKRNKISIIFKDIEQLQGQAEHIIKLLQIEGVDQDQNNLEELGQIPLTDLAYRLLSSNMEKNPIHYRNLAESLLANGTLIPGRDPAANLLSHISRDERFIRTSPGTYGLVEWGLKPQIRKSSKSKRRKTKRN